MKFFSIIVPIYKIEEYIDECILSVLNQTFYDYELILVDDGSPDNCGKICDKYKENNSNIVVVHKKNGGLSDARNAGIDVSNGKYIMFLDGDDTLVAGSLTKISEEIKQEKADLLVCDFNIYGNQSIECPVVRKKIKDVGEFIDYYGDIPWAAWRNIYDAKVIKENNLKFVKGLVGAEDCEFFIRYFDKAKNVIYINEKIVNYRVNRKNSITNKIKFNAIKGQLEVFAKYFNKYYAFNNRQVYELFAKKYVNTISTIYNLDDTEEIRLVTAMIDDNKEILKKAYGFKYSISKLIFQLFGYYNGSKILKILK